jgi:hypothetical protein
MAIRINGTTVISDSRKLENIVDCTGTFEDFHSTPVTIVDNINFTNPMMSLTMSGNVTFTESGIAEGRTCTLLLDTSSNTHTPTFSSTINWPDNTEPTWGDYQRWMITFHAVSATEVRANAVGYTETTAPPPTETIALSGTTSTPVFHFDTAGTGDLVMGWRFGSDGNIYKYEDVNNIGGSGMYLYSSTQWNNITPSTTYYIRVTNFGGTVNLSVSDSDTINSWITLSSNRDFRIRDSRNVSSYADEDMVMKVEIASDSGGSNILATGYYSCSYSGTA